MTQHKKKQTLTPEILQQALVGSFQKLNPRYMMKNPVMFVVEIGFAVTLLLAIFPGLFGEGGGMRAYNAIVAVILFITVLFANFAESVAEGRGKAQAASLKKTQKDTMARLLTPGGDSRTVASSELRRGDIVLVKADTISRQLVEKRITLEEAQEALKSLRQKDSISLVKAMVCSGGAAGFFAMLYGGGWVEFFCALLAGMCAHLAMYLIGKVDSSQLIKALAGSFTAAIIARALNGPYLTSDESMVIIGAIMPMLPGLAVTNAIRDMMHGDLVSGNAKLFEGIMTACAIAAGVFMALNFI